jgi:hypothetical protein
MVINVIQKGCIMFIKSCWVILALIHAIPAFAFFKPSLLTSLYKVQADSAAYVLLHHRAALFFGVFIACIWALLQPGSRQLATIVVGVSMISFLVLFAISGMTDSLRIIAIADLIGIPFLTIAAWQAFRNAKV